MVSHSGQLTKMHETFDVTPMPSKLVQLQLLQLLMPLGPITDTPRWSPTAFQLQKLNATYMELPRPSLHQRRCLLGELKALGSINAYQLSKWFENRRSETARRVHSPVPATMRKKKSQQRPQFNNVQVEIASEFFAHTEHPTAAERRELLVKLKRNGEASATQLRRWFAKACATTNYASHSTLVALHISDIDIGKTQPFEEGQCSNSNVLSEAVCPIPLKPTTTLMPTTSSTTFSSDVHTLIIKKLSRVAVVTWSLPPAPRCSDCGAKRFYREPPGFCCCSGQIKLTFLRMSDALWDLYTNYKSTVGRDFCTRVRTYNNTYAFTSLGMSTESDFTFANKSVYTLKVHGRVHHYLNPFTPSEGLPQYAQIYFYDPIYENSIRQTNTPSLTTPGMECIRAGLSLNPYGVFLRSLHTIPTLEDFKIVLRAHPTLDKRVYNEPMTDHVAAIWKHNEDATFSEPQDLRVYSTNGHSYSINYLYSCYDPLQYPLLFPYGEPGWRLNIPRQRKGTTGGKGVKRKRCCYSFDPTTHTSLQSLLLAESDSKHFFMLYYFLNLPLFKGNPENSNV